MVKLPWDSSESLFYEVTKMIDKREGETKKKAPSEPGIFPQNKPVPCNPSNVQPSQKKAPKQVYGD